MSFRLIMKLALQGYPIRLEWWKKNHYIVLKDDGFYDENNNPYIVENYKGVWKPYIKGVDGNE